MCVCLRVQGSERPPLYITPYPLVSISNHGAKPFRILRGRPTRASRLFLARLLDALGARVHGSLALADLAS
jgi:hypothetical protein